MLEIKFAVEAETVGRCEAHGLTENVSPTVGFEYRFATSSKLSKLELHGHSKTIHLLSHSARWSRLARLHHPASRFVKKKKTSQGRQTLQNLVLVRRLGRGIARSQRLAIFYDFGFRGCSIQSHGTRLQRGTSLCDVPPGGRDAHDGSGPVFRCL